MSLGKSLDLTKLQVSHWQNEHSNSNNPKAETQVKQFVHLTHSETTINGSKDDDDGYTIICSTGKQDKRFCMICA